MRITASFVAGFMCMGMLGGIVPVPIATLQPTSAYAAKQPAAGKNTAKSKSDKKAAAQNTKKDEQIQVFKRERVKVADEEEFERKGPGLAAEEVIRVFKTEAQARRDEAIRLLRDMIRETPDSAPEKPELFFRLSELMWERANHFRMRAFGYDPDIWATEKTDPARHAQLQRMKQEDLDRARQFRLDTLKIYEAIHKHYPNYEKMDEVLFFMGFNYTELGEKEKAQVYLRDLIQRFPNSRFIPDAYLAFGEFFFGINEVEAALKFYQKAAEFKEKRVYGFAIYKQAWCYINLSQNDKALEKLLQVIEYSDSEESREDVARLSLRKEAIKDLVMPYSYVGKGTKALEFFKEVAADEKEHVGMAERLARIYSGRGENEEANALYRELIRARMHSPDVIKYEYQIVLNVERQGNRDATVKEAERLAALFRTLRDNGVLKDKSLKETANQVQSLLKEYATTWHREAQVTKAEVYYRHAHDMYREYIETFPEAEDVYLMTYYYAELLYALQDWEKAAVTYRKVIGMDEAGEHAQSSAHAMLLSYQKLLDMEEARQQDTSNLMKDIKSRTSAGNKGKGKKDEEKQFVPKDIAAIQLDFISACEIYARLVPNGEYVVDAKYMAALIYYEHFHFKDAIARFDDIVTNHAEHRLATYSANLILDSYNALRDYEMLNNSVRRFLGIEAIAQGKLLELLQSIMEESTFKACLSLEEKNEFKSAADAFMAFSKEFPNSDLVDKAYYNAAVNFDKSNHVDMAIEARIELIQQRPGSDLVPKAFYAIGRNYQAIAIYSEAARFFELFAAQFSKDSNAPAALNNAAVFRQGLGEEDKALENFKKYISSYGKSNPERAALLFFQQGTIYERQEMWPTVITHYQEFLKKWARHQKKDKTIQAWTKIGLAYKKQNNRKSAEGAFNEAVSAFSKLKADEIKTMPEGVEAAAHARYQIGEYLFEDYKAIKLDDSRKLAEKLQEKLKRMFEAQKVYEDVIKFYHPNWIIAAWAKIGEGYMELAEAVRNSPTPPGFDEDETYVYKDELEQQAYKFDQDAIRGFARCMELAQQLRWFNEYTVYAEKHLSRLNPTEFTMDREIRAKATYMGEGFRSSPFVDSRPKSVKSPTGESKEAVGGQTGAEAAQDEAGADSQAGANGAGAGAGAPASGEERK